MHHVPAAERKLRVALLGPYPPPHGGVEVHVASLHRYLRERGIESCVLNITRHRKQDGDGVRYPAGATQLLRQLARFRADVAHLHVGGTLPTRVMALGLLCTLLARRSVFTFHSGGYPASVEGRRDGRHGFRAFVLRRFDHVIGVNDELTSYFRRLGVPDKRLHCIAPHAVPPLPHDDIGLPPDDPLARFMARHDPVLVSVSGLQEEYDVPTQIRALELMRAEVPCAGLVVIGTGRDADKLRALAASSSAASALFLAGDVAHSRALRAIANADIFLRTTLYDGDSISVREALAYGTPAIVTDNGMRPAGTHLVPTRDPTAIVAKIHELLNQPSPRTAVEATDDNLAQVVDLYAD